MQNLLGGGGGGAWGGVGKQVCYGNVKIANGPPL